MILRALVLAWFFALTGVSGGPPIVLGPFDSFAECDRARAKHYATSQCWQGP